MPKICIDPGHGGKDSGAVGIFKEKDLNLKVALNLGKILKDSGQTVVFTRTTDVFIELADRVRISNNERADVFVSIHQNGAPNNSARGVETYYYRGSEKGKALALNIQKELVNLNYTLDRGVKEAEYYVIKYLKAVAVLVECGFVTNEQDAKAVDEKVYEIAFAIAKGIGKFLGFEVKQRIVTVVADVLNIRKGPSVKYQVVGTYKKGDKIVIIEEQDGWGRTDKGWINLNYVKKPAG